MQKDLTIRNPETPAEKALVESFEHLGRVLDAMRCAPDIGDAPTNMDSRRFNKIRRRELDAAEVRYSMMRSLIRNRLGEPEA